MILFGPFHVRTQPCYGSLQTVSLQFVLVWCYVHNYFVINMFFICGGVILILNLIIIIIVMTKKKKKKPSNPICGLGWIPVMGWVGLEFFNLPWCVGLEKSLNTTQLDLCTLLVVAFIPSCL